MPKIYDSVPTNHPPRNRFDLSHSHFFSARVGLLYPALCMEMYPGDVFKISDAVHAELQPMVAPLLSDLILYAHTLFVPYRLLYGVDHSDGKSIWEKFITGGEKGDYATPLPSWRPSFNKTTFSSETIWDYVGNPVKNTPSGGTNHWTPIVPFGLNVSCAPKLAYNLIWNSYMRDENLQEEIDITTNEDLLYADWRKDYFTSALESQQLGTAPALPLTGHLPLQVSQFAGKTNISNGVSAYDTQKPNMNYPINSTSLDLTSVALVGGQYATAGHPFYVDVANAATFNVADMRLVFAMQRLMELTMLSGHRYTEFLHSHFGVSPTDARLDRPEYVGGCQFPISVGVTVQTSATGDVSPQGNKVGVGNINDVMSIGSYRAEEYGLLMTLVSIRPKPCYTQGVNRQWLRQTRFDYYSPEFANLSEQAIYNAELYCDGVDHTGQADPRNDNGLFGYQAHWNELRAQNNYVTGSMRDQFDYWLMSRKFSSRPALNADFVSLNHPEEYNRIWAVQSEDQFIIAWSNIIDAFRPLPAFGTPGLIDHVYGGI